MGKRAAHSLHREGIAVIGVAFRFPGDLDNEDAFWKALTSGRDLVTEIGPERWAVEELQHPKRSEPGRSVTFSAGVLSRIDEFDAGFFGISPREAVLLDPQQRLLLELAWEAMENGGQVPARLAGSDCAVYVGVSALDYGLRGISDFSNVSMHTMTGNTLSIAANRISYAFDLHGPSLSVDTACSSSLVALHQACDALQRGEAPMALVGGVNLLLHPYAFVGFTKASMISANGRCRAFDAAADGYVRAEGGAVLLLKPLAQAEKDGDAIQAVIRATGVNSDGGRKTGITIPSSEGQADLMRSALKKSGIRPEDVAYIEAHGTGTAVGDPVEANAIGEVYGRERKAPLSIGSVKTNLGHLEAASGMAGLVKTMLMLKHEALPPSLHFETPNPHIPFADLNLQVVTQHTPLQKDKNPPVMGVNSFGFGGANAHALLQGYRPVSGAKPSRPPHVPPLLLSARTQEALQDMAGRYVGLLQDPDAAEYYDIAYSAAFHRQHLEHRLAIMPADARSARAMLESYAAGEAMAGVIEENALSASASDGVTFVYSGNGAQWEGMGRKLLRELPAFAAIIKELDAAIARKAGFSVLDALTENENNADLSDTAIAQPLLFAMQVAITKILRARGVEAKAAAGHSVGEVAAAWATGALSLSQAIDVICARSAAQAKTRGKGRMAAVGLPEDAIREILDEGGYSTIEIAGVNSPSNVTLAGSLAELEALQAQLQPRGTFYRLLDLDYAFHSRAMDGIRTDIGKSLAALSPSATAIDFVSTVTGDVLEGQSLGAGYWWDNVRKPVRFAAGMETLIKRGCGILLEIGPHAILQRYMTECLLKEGGAGRALPTLRRDDDGLSRLDGAVLRVHMSRHEPDPSFFFPQKGRFTPLPNYPWQRERYLVSETTESASILERRRVHPLLGWRLKDHEAAWENVLDPVEYPYLADHRVGGSIVLPATGYLEMALAASREWFKGERFKIEEMNIIAPVVFDGEHARSIRFLFSPREGTFRILSRERLSADDWTLNAAGLLLGAPARRARNGASVSRPKKAVTVKAQEHYRLFDALGLDYGPAFRGFARGSMKGDVLTGKFELPDALQEDIDDYMLHPALLDACFQPLVNFFKDEVEAGRGRAFLPIKTGRLQYFGGGPVTDFEIRLQSRSRRSIRADFILQDAAGEAVALLEGCRFRAAPLRRKSEARPVRWRIDARLAPHASVCSAPELPGSREWIKTAQDYMAQAEPSLQRQRIFGEYQPLLDALVVAYAYRAFHTLDEKMRPWLNKVLDEPETITEDRRPFFIFLNRLLQDVGLLKRAGTGWEIETADAPP
ncbi:MAG: acyltransferase domain-containing protein, partial [Alphaproteobacteria bacterium]|nr:acyltransferase domain-containing protein [Alphaproteobacteria bacterium]